jgi:hypothetical protein
MKRPRIAPLLSDIVRSGILSCEGTIFDSRNTCPFCGGKVSGYDTKKKQFAVLQDHRGVKPVQVFIRRFACRECHAVCYAEEPFYPDTRTGSPLVDLCRTLGETMPGNRVAASLLSMGIVIDRGTVRNYRKRPFPDIPQADLFGMHLPLSVLSLADLATRFGEGSPIPGAEVLAACGFPSAYGAAPDRLLSPEQGNKRKEEENKEKWQAIHP